MSKRTEADFLYDILEAARNILSYTNGLGYEEFLEDRKTQDAVIRNIEIIGEAVKCLSVELKQEHENIPWRNMARMRDKLIHHYFGATDAEIINIY